MKCPLTSDCSRADAVPATQRTSKSRARQTLLEKSLVTLAVFPCAGVGMLTPRSDWLSESHDCKVNYILEVGSTLITIAPGKVSLFWPNESCTKISIHSSNPEDTGYIDTMVKT